MGTHFYKAVLDEFMSHDRGMCICNLFGFMHRLGVVEKPYSMSEEYQEFTKVAVEFYHKFGFPKGAYVKGSLMSVATIIK